MMGAMSAPTGEPTPLDFLATLVRQQRVALGYRSKEAAAEACGLSHMPYRNVEAGRPASALTYTKIEQGLKLAPGACRHVLDGGDSLLLADGTELIVRARLRNHDLSHFPEDLRAGVMSAASATAPDLSVGQADEMTRRVLEYLQERGYQLKGG